NSPDRMSPRGTNIIVHGAGVTGTLGKMAVLNLTFTFNLLPFTFYLSHPRLCHPCGKVYFSERSHLIPAVCGTEPTRKLSSVRSGLSIAPEPTPKFQLRRSGLFG